MSKAKYRVDPREYDTRMPNACVPETRTPIGKGHRKQIHNCSSSPYIQSSSSAMCPASSSGYRVSTANSLQEAPVAQTNKAVTYTKFPDLPVSDHYIPGAHSYQPYQRAGPLSEPTEFSLLDTTYLPKTPLSTLPPFSFETIAQRQSVYTQCLPGSPPQFLRVVNPDPPTPDTPGTSVLGASCVCPSSAQQETKVENRNERPKMALQKDAENPYISNFDSKEFDGVFQKCTAMHKDNQTLNVDLQDTTRNLESILQYPRHAKSEAGFERKWQRKWCIKHFIYDFCAFDQGKPDMWTSSPSKNTVNMLGNERTSASNANVPTRPVAPAPASSTIIGPPLAEAKDETPDVIPGRIRTDPNHFVDFIEHQRSSRALYDQHRVQLLELSLGKQLQADRKKESERLLEEARKAEARWQSGVEKVTKDLKTIEKRLQAISKTPSCGRMQQSEMISNNKAVKTAESNSSLTLVKELDSLDTTEKSFTSMRAAIAFIEPAAGRYREKLESGEGLKMTISLPPTEQEAESEAVEVAGSSTDSFQVVKAERSTSRTRIIAAKLQALEAQAEEDGNWENVNMSDDDDDDDWEKVVGDNSGGWELLAK